MTETIRDQAVQIYDAFTHEHRDRRTLLRQMTLLAGSAAAAEALIVGIAASPVAAAMIDPSDKRIQAAMSTGTEAGAPARGYFAKPRGVKPIAYVLVIHENRGLTPHIQDVARRVALAGYAAIAPDLLAPQGGTPADENRARDLIGTVDYDLALRQARSFADRARAQRGGPKKVGIVGFCWGGAFVNRMAAAGGVDAGVSYYGPAPAPAEALRIACPLLIQLPEKDARVTTTVLPFVEAAKAAGKPVTLHIYPGVDHAFNNDTSVERYNKAAADLAWARTTAFFKDHLTA